MLNHARVLAMLALSATLPVTAAEIQIGAGTEDGEYTQTVIPAINKALETQGHSATAITTAGSQENIDKLLADELKAALVQLDVLALNEDAADLQVLGLLAPEALLCAAKEGGPVRSYYNLTDRYTQPLIISMGEPGSGTARTLEFILSLDAELDVSKFDLVYEPNTAAELDRLAAGNRDLVCFVRVPNPDNALIEQVNDSDDLMFIDFVSAAALTPMQGDIPLYTTMSVPVSKGVFGIGADKVDTLTTWMALVARSDLDPEIKAALEQTIADPELLPPTTPAGKAQRLFGDFKEKTMDWTQNAKEKASAMTASAREKASELTAAAKDKAIELRQKAGEMTEQAMQKAGEMTEQAKEKAIELKEKAGEMTEQAMQKAGEMTEQAKEKAAELKKKAGEMTEQAKDAVTPDSEGASDTGASQ